MLCSNIKKYGPTIEKIGKNECSTNTRLKCALRALLKNTGLSVAVSLNCWILRKWVTWLKVSNGELLSSMNKNFVLNLK